MSSERKLWIDRHPILTFGAVLAAFGLAGLIGAETYLAGHAASAPYSPEARYVRISLHSGNADRDVVPPAGLLAESDSLEEKRFRFRTTDRGFVLPSFQYDAPDSLVVFIGGSTTESIYVDEDKRWPALVSPLLSEKMRMQIATVNAGVGGNNSMEGNVILLSEVLPLKPDIVVLMNAVNDIGLLHNEGSYWNNNSRRSIVIDSGDNSLRNNIRKTVRSLKNKTFPYVYRAGISGIGRLRGSSAAVGRIEESWTEVRPPDHTLIVGDFEHSVATFVGITRAWGVTPVLATQPSRYAVYAEQTDTAAVQAYLRALRARGIPTEDFSKLHGAMNDTIRRVAERTGTLLIDLDRMIPKTSRYFYDMVHLNTEGSVYQAGAVSDALEQVVRDTLAKAPVR